MVAITVATNSTSNVDSSTLPSGSSLELMLGDQSTLNISDVQNITLGSVAPQTGDAVGEARINLTDGSSMTITGSALSNADTPDTTKLDSLIVGLSGGSSVNVAGPDMVGDEAAVDRYHFIFGDGDNHVTLDPGIHPDVSNDPDDIDVTIRLTGMKPGDTFTFSDPDFADRVASDFQSWDISYHRDGSNLTGIAYMRLPGDDTHATILIGIEMTPTQFDYFADSWSEPSPSYTNYVTPSNSGESISITVPANGVSDGVVSGTSGNDRIGAQYVDPQGDRIDANDVDLGSDDDLVDAGAGNDTVIAFEGNDTVYGGTGDDSIEGGSGSDSLVGGDGADTIYGEGNSVGITIDMRPSEPEDFLSGYYTSTSLGHITSDNAAGNDTIHGDAGSDVLYGGVGDDAIYGGTEDDTLDGGVGNDLLDGGEGADQLTGGEGYDVFVAGDGDTITDFNTASGQNLTDGDPTNNDFVDLSQHYSDANLATMNAYRVANGMTAYQTPLAWLRGDQADGVLDDISTAHGFGSNFSMTILSGSSATAANQLTADNTGVTCFDADTLIQTASGPVRAGDLQVGDLVLTVDNGAQPIRWVGSRTLDAAELSSQPHLRPIRIAKGALGRDMPSADLVVSPQHRVLVRSRIAQRMFSVPEVLVAAKTLLELPGIEVADDMEAVTYVHFLFDSHQVVFSNGALTESLYTGPQALKSVGETARQEILALFPELAEEVVPVGARQFLTGKSGLKLAGRHLRNCKPLVEG